MWRDNEQNIGILEQSAWGTPQAVSASYRKMLYEPGSVNEDLNLGINTINTTSSKLLFATNNRVTVDNKPSYKRLSFSGFATVKNISDHVQGFFHRVTEDAATPFLKQWLEPTSIDFKGGDGTVFSVVAGTRNPSVVSDGVQLQNAIVENLELSIDLLAQSPEKYLKMQGNWVGTKMLTGQNLSGTWKNEDNSTTASYQPTYYNSNANPFINSITLLIDSVDLSGCISKFSMMMKHNILATNCLTSDGYPNQIVLGIPTIDYVIEIPYNSTTYIVLDKFKNGANVEFSAFGTNTAMTSLNGLRFYCDYGRLTKNPVITKDGYKAIQLNIKKYPLEVPVVSPIILSDGVDKNW